METATYSIFSSVFICLFPGKGLESITVTTLSLDRIKYVHKSKKNSYET